MDAHKQGTLCQNQGTFFAKLGHVFSIFKIGQGKPQTSINLFIFALKNRPFSRK